MREREEREEGDGERGRHRNCDVACPSTMCNVRRYNELKFTAHNTETPCDDVTRPLVSAAS